MPTIKELNEAIKTIRKECRQQHNDCRSCPMHINCFISVPAEWDTIEVGEQDGNDEFETVWDVVDWLEERCQKIKDEDILERYRQVYFDLISEIANKFREHLNKDGETDAND